MSLDREDLSRTQSGISLKPIYPLDEESCARPGGRERPGEFPFTRGIHREMYRERLFQGLLRPNRLGGRGPDRVLPGKSLIAHAYCEAAVPRVTGIARALPRGASKSDSSTFWR